MNCAWIRNQTTLYFYNELDDPERREIEQHLERCGECAAVYAEEKRLHQVLDARPRAAVDPTLLASCRMQLAEAIENEPARQFSWARLWAALAPLKPRFQPSFAAVLVVAGFVGGWVVSSYRAQAPLLPTSRPSDETVISDVSSLPGIVPNISNIHAIHTNPQGQLEIVFETSRRRVVRTEPGDPRVEPLLIYAAKNYSNPGIRLDSIELLKDRAGDHDIRGALIAALRGDRNPGVRLKALESLKGYAADQEVKQALLDVLRRDDNAGVRIQAIEQLTKLRDASTVPVLQQVAAGDPNSYVRSRSVSALRELNASEIF